MWVRVLLVYVVWPLSVGVSVSLSPLWRSTCSRKTRDSPLGDWLVIFIRFSRMSLPTGDTSWLQIRKRLFRKVWGGGHNLLVVEPLQYRTPSAWGRQSLVLGLKSLEARPSSC